MLGSILIMMGSPLTVKSLQNDKDCNDNETKKETDKEFTLVLDLDETLIHSEMERTSFLDEEIIVKIGNSIEKYYVKIRPFARDFLRNLS